MSKWVNIGARIPEEEKAEIERYLNGYNKLNGTTFTLSGFVRYLLVSMAETFNTEHPKIYSDTWLCYNSTCKQVKNIGE